MNKSQLGGVWYDQYNRPITNLASVYQGANETRHRARLPRADFDSHQNLDPWTRRQLLSTSQFLYENVGFAKGAVRDIGRYSIGDTLIPQSQIADKAVRLAYENYWNNWANIPEVTNQWNYGEICRMRSYAVDVAGDIGQIYTQTPTGFPRLQIVEAHRIESDPNVEGYRDGVLCDAMGAPAFYSVRVDDGDYRKIEARNFHLLLDPDRVDQKRGKTAFHHALNTLRDVLEILGAEKTGVKVNATLALIIKLATAEAQGSSAMFGKQAVQSVGDEDLNLDKLIEGMIPRLRAGEEIMSHSSDRPSPTFTGFLDYLLRDVANGLGVPWEFVWDSSKLGGSGNRLAIHKAQRKFNERQSLMKKVATRDWGYVVSKGANRGDLPYHPDWWRVVWQTTRKITVDEGRDADQNRKDIFAGLRTCSEDFSERGLDWEESRDQQEREIDDLMERAKRTADRWGISIEKALETWQLRGPNPMPVTSDSTSAKPQG